MKTFLIEIYGYNPVLGAEDVVRFCTVQFEAFPPSDSLRPNVFYAARIEDIAPIPRYMYGSGKTYGATSSAGGSLSIINADNQYDHLLDWGFDGRRLNVFYGEIGAAFSTFVQVIAATVEQPESSFSKSEAATLKFVFRDKWQIFNKPLAPNFYAGTNSGATGNEGTADDLKGKRKPIALGVCLNVTAAPCNTSALRYQVNDGPIDDVPKCYIDGVEQTKVTGVPGLTQYAIDISTGIATLGSSPAGGVVTWDVQGAKFSGTYYNSVGDLVKNVAVNFGGAAIGDINTTSVTALNALNNAPVGLFIEGSSDESVASVLDTLLNSIGAYGYFNRLGVLQVGRLSDPVGGTSVKTFIERDFDEFMSVSSSDDDKGIPVYKVSINHSINYTVQTQVAGAVTEARRAFLSLDKRTESDTDASIKTAHLLSPELKRDSNLTSSAAAATEATRVLNLKKVQRRFYKAVVSYEGNEGLDLSNVITVQMARLGFGSGKKLIIDGIIEHSPTPNKMTLELWG